MCLYEIAEIIVVNNSTDEIFILSKQIQGLDFLVQFEAFEVDKNTIINNCTIHGIDEFSGPLNCNITKIASGKHMIRLKEFF